MPCSSSFSSLCSHLLINENLRTGPGPRALVSAPDEVCGITEFRYLELLAILVRKLWSFCQWPLLLCGVKPGQNTSTSNMDVTKSQFDLHSRLHLLRFLMQINPADPTTTDEYWADLLKNRDLTTIHDMLHATILDKYATDERSCPPIPLTNFVHLRSHFRVSLFAELPSNPFTAYD